MKKIMLAVAALAVVASVSLSSCGKKDPKAAAEALVKEMQEYAAKPDTDPKAAAEKAAGFIKKAQEILESCKTAEDSAAVEQVFNSINL